MEFDFNRLKMFRKQRGLTQEQVAEKLSVSRQAVAKWESGDSLPDIENVIALADMYEVSVDSLARNLAAQSAESGDGKHLFGMTRVSENGQITLPKKARDIFGLAPGSAVLILGDESKGLAIVKVSEIDEK